MKLTKPAKRKRIRYRIRKKIKGTAQRPRLSIFRSNRGIYGQVIDDIAGNTLVTASSQDPSVPQNITKKEQARMVGKLLGEKALAKNITTVVFDRGGYLYHGRVKELADGAREVGLNL